MPIYLVDSGGNLVGWGGAPDPVDTAPAAPTGLVAESGDGQITLTWDPNTEPDIADYRVRRANPSQLLTTVTHPTTTAVIGGLTNGVTYEFTVRARDAGGLTSPDSAHVTSSPTAPSISTGTIIGMNAGDDPGAGNDSVAEKLSWAGGMRIPRNRWYYGLNALPVSFDTNKQGGAPEKSVQVSFKRTPSQITDGSYDARITSYLTSIPADWRVLFTFWHEPNSEINSGQFTAAQFKAANIHINNLIISLGLTDRVRLAPNFTGPYPQIGTVWSDSWMMTPDQIPGAIWTWDQYGNLYGGTAYDSPYRSIAEVIDPIFQRIEAYGWWNAWGITEFNTPRRNHDPAETARTQWIQDYVDYCMTGGSAAPRQILLWEGAGVQFDQFFYTQLLKDKWRDITATSPAGNAVL